MRPLSAAPHHQLSCGTALGTCPELSIQPSPCLFPRSSSHLVLAASSGIPAPDIKSMAALLGSVHRQSRSSHRFGEGGPILCRLARSTIKQIARPSSQTPDLVRGFSGLVFPERFGVLLENRHRQDSHLVSRHQLSQLDGRLPTPSS